MTVNELHERAFQKAKQIRTHYREFFEILLEVERRQIYLQFDILHLKAYCVELLFLSDSVANDFVTVVKKSLEVPSLAKAILEDKVTISKARKVCPVITESNSKVWIANARECTARIIEKCVALAKPQEAVQDSMKYVASNVLEFKLGVSEDWEQLLKKTKDIMSSKKQVNVTSEEALFYLMQEFCEKNDPVKKAERAQKRKAATAGSAMQPPPSVSSTDSRKRAADCDSAVDSEISNAPTAVTDFSLERTIKTTSAALTGPEVRAHHFGSRENLGRHIPAESVHAVNLRDQVQCAYVDRWGRRCEEKRWLDIHHINEFANGGDHRPENLTTLCGGHHRLIHRRSAPTGLRVRFG